MHYSNSYYEQRRERGGIKRGREKNSDNYVTEIDKFKVREREREGEREREHPCSIDHHMACIDSCNS